MPQPDLVPLAQRLDARFDELVDRLVEQLPDVSTYYASMPLDQRRTASITLYKVIRASVEEGGIEQFARAITQVGRARLAQGGSTDDLRAATDLVRRINLSLVDELAHNEPGAAAAAFTWLDRLASTSFEVFTFQTDLRNAQLSLIQALLDYNKSLADLERAKGTLLESKGLELAADAGR